MLDFVPPEPGFEDAVPEEAEEAVPAAVLEEAEPAPVLEEAPLAAASLSLVAATTAGTAPAMPLDFSPAALPAAADASEVRAATSEMCSALSEMAFCCIACLDFLYLFQTSHMAASSFIALKKVGGGGDVGVRE